MTRECVMRNGVTEGQILVWLAQAFTRALPMPGPIMSDDGRLVTETTFYEPGPMRDWWLTFGCQLLQEIPPCSSV